MGEPVPQAQKLHHCPAVCTYLTSVKLALTHDLGGVPGLVRLVAAAALHPTEQTKLNNYPNGSPYGTTATMSTRYPY